MVNEPDPINWARDAKFMHYPCQKYRTVNLKIRFLETLKVTKPHFSTKCWYESKTSEKYDAKNCKTDPFAHIFPWIVSVKFGWKLCRFSQWISKFVYYKHESTADENPTRVPVADPGYPEVGRRPSRRGAPTYEYAKFSQKLHEIKRIWTGGRVSLAPP